MGKCSRKGKRWKRKKKFWILEKEKEEKEEDGECYPVRVKAKTIFLLFCFLLLPPNLTIPLGVLDDRRMERNASFELKRTS